MHKTYVCVYILIIYACIPIHIYISRDRYKDMHTYIFNYICKENKHWQHKPKINKNCNLQSVRCGRDFYKKCDFYEYTLLQSLDFGLIQMIYISKNIN